MVPENGVIPTDEEQMIARSVIDLVDAEVG